LRHIFVAQHDVKLGIILSYPPHFNMAALADDNWVKAFTHEFCQRTMRHMNEMHRAPRGDNSNLSARIASYELAYKMQSNAPEVRRLRRTIVQMMFVEGNHYCPSCEKSGNCKLQATAYYLGLHDNRFNQMFPKRGMDSSHPDVHLDRDRCILCEICVRASRALDHKGVFGAVGRGIKHELSVNSPSGTLVDSAIAPTDKAVELCPTGALQPKHRGFQVPIGERLYDQEPIDVVGLRQYQECVHGK